MIGKIEDIKVLALDVDGVLTDGRMILGSAGLNIKFFDVHDGLGIILWKRAGLKSAIITANKSSIVDVRADRLKIDKVYQGAMDKLEAYNNLKTFFGVSDHEVCFIGDDILDLPVLSRVGFSCAVSNAVEDVTSSVDYVTTKKGGRGAVREVIDFILKKQGKWEDLLEPYRK